MDNSNNAEQENLGEGMKTAISDIRLSAIKINYSLEDINDETIEGWIKKSLISDDPIDMLLVLKWRIQEFGKQIPPVTA